MYFSKIKKWSKDGKLILTKNERYVTNRFFRFQEPMKCEVREKKLSQIILILSKLPYSR